MLQFGECPKCRTLPRLVPVHGGFAWSCDCPPAQTYTSNNTGCDCYPWPDVCPYCGGNTQWPDTAEPEK